MAVLRDEKEYDIAFMWFFNDSGLNDNCTNYDVSVAAEKAGIEMTKSFWEAIVRAIWLINDR